MGSPLREVDPLQSEDNVSPPKASMNKMIEELVPSVKLGKMSKELIINCCNQFTQIISTEANRICKEKNIQYMKAEHIIEALDKLGFSDYNVDVQATLDDCKAKASKRQHSKLENRSIMEDQLPGTSKDNQ